MSIRAVACAVAVALPIVLVTVGCESGSSSPASGAPDAQVTGFEAGASDAPAADTSVAADAGADATDAADAALTTTLPFATGLGAAGTALADGQIDPHWSVKDANGVALTAYVQTDALGYAGYWLAPSAASKFISPFIDTVDPTGSGTFTYTTKFVLGPEVDLSKVQLVVRYASDNGMTAIAVNGQSVAAVAAGSYSAFETVMVLTPFVRGSNSVALTVANSGGPTGMRAELDLTK